MRGVKMRKERKEKNIFEKTVIVATIIILTIGSITPLITAKSEKDINTQTIEYKNDFNNKQLVQVEVSRWAENNKIVTSLEFWPKDKINGFLKALEGADYEHCLTIMQQYDLVPKDKTQDDLENFLADQYQQINEDFEKHKDLEISKENGHFFESAIISGEVYAPFFCFRIPMLFYAINSGNGGDIYIELQDYCVSLDGNQHFNMVIYIWLGIFSPPLRNGRNYINRGFGGTAFNLYISVS